MDLHKSIKSLAAPGPPRLAAARPVNNNTPIYIVQILNNHLQLISSCSNTRRRRSPAVRVSAEVRAVECLERRRSTIRFTQKSSF